MTSLYRRTLFWAPRVLSIAYIAFLSMFAFDVLGEKHGWGETLLALTVHLIPVFVLIAGLLLAWRREWIGATLYAAAGMLYVIWVLRLPRPLSATMKLTWILTLAGPVFVIAGLFLANWLRRGELHAKPS